MVDTIILWLKRKESLLLAGDSTNKRFLRDTFWLMAGNVAPLLLGMISSIAVARMLDKSVYGQYGMVINTVAIIGTFAGLGLGVTSIKHVAEFRKSDPGRAVRIMRLTDQVALISGGAASILLFAFAGPFASRILNAPELASPLRIGCLLLFFNTLNGTQTGALYGLESFRAATKVNTLRAMVNFPVLIGATFFFGLAGAVSGTVFSGVAGWYFNKIILEREKKKVGLPDNNGTTLSELGILFKFALPALLSGVMTAPVLWLANTILVNTPGGYGELGLVNASSQWKNLLMLLPSIFCSSALPILASEGTPSSGRSQAIDLPQKATIAIILPLYTLVIFLGNAIIGLYGRSFASGYTVLVGITFGACLFTLSNIGATKLAASNRMWLSLLFNMTWGIVLIICVYSFSAQWGANGYAAGYVLADLSLFMLLMLYLRKFFLNSTMLLTVLSVIYLTVMTLVCLKAGETGRLYLSVPFMLLSLTVSYLALGRQYSLKILGSVSSLLSRGKAC